MKSVRVRKWFQKAFVQNTTKEATGCLSSIRRSAQSRCHPPKRVPRNRARNPPRAAPEVLSQYKMCRSQWVSEFRTAVRQPLSGESGGVEGVERWRTVAPVGRNEEWSCGTGGVSETDLWIDAWRVEVVVGDMWHQWRW